jgi:hypothetical protein
MEDIIHNPAAVPSFDQISAYIHPPGRELWLDLNGFIQQTFNARPKIDFSVCAGKPGWNVKYQKSGKSICTLYPDRECLVALVVVKLELAELLKSVQPPLHPLIHQLIVTGKPFNKTLWLMISIENQAVLESVKDLLVHKQNF